jgi:hypothetical protein
MGIVNPTEVHPGIMRAIYRICVQRGLKSPISIKELKALIAPESAVHEGANPLLSAERTITESVSIGMLKPHSARSTDSYRVAFNSPPADADDREAETHFVRELRALVFGKANNDLLFGAATIDEDGAEADAKDELPLVRSCEFTRIQAWLLMQDPTSAPLSWSEASAGSVVQLQARHPLVSNGNRWTNFRRWSLYLGLSRQDGKGGVIADPSRALRDELPDVAAGKSDMPLIELIDGLAARIPVLDGGSYRRQVNEHVEVNEDPLIASPSLALALLGAQDAGLLSFTTRDDFSGGSVRVGSASHTHAVFEAGA